MIATSCTNSPVSLSRSSSFARSRSNSTNQRSRGASPATQRSQGSSPANQRSRGSSPANQKSGCSSPANQRSQCNSPANQPSNSSSVASSLANSPSKRKPGLSSDSPIPPARRGSIRSNQSSPKFKLVKSHTVGALVTGLPPPKPPRTYAKNQPGTQTTIIDVTPTKLVEEITVPVDVHPPPGILTRSRSKYVTKSAGSKPAIVAKTCSFDTVDLSTARSLPTSTDRSSLSLTDELEIKFKEMQNRFKHPEPHFGYSTKSETHFGESKPLFGSSREAKPQLGKLDGSEQKIESLRDKPDAGHPR